MNTYSSLNVTELKEQMIDTMTPGVREEYDNFADRLTGLINHDDELLNFDDIISTFDRIFNINNVNFSNNGENSSSSEAGGSLKILTLALLLDFDASEALRMFGKHYQDVLENPSGDSHPNIRALMSDIQTGMKQVVITGLPFTPKTEYSTNEEK